MVIVGAGLAGVSCAAELRKQGFGGSITLFNDEPVSPYDRPPLSKGYAAGEQSADDIRLQPKDWYEEQRITLENECAVARVDAQQGAVVCQDGRRFGYEHLVLATGSRARDLAGVPGLGRALGDRLHTIRTIDDSNRVKAVLEPGCRFLFVGGGVIGMELAATVVQAGCEATVVEAQSQIMGRFFPAEVSQFLTAVHLGNGVKVALGTKISRVTQEPSGEIEVELADGEALRVDEIVVAVGAVPDTRLAHTASAEVASGVVVDGSCRTSVDRILACGDVAEFDHPRYGQTRWENWKHAQQHGQHAARCLLGNDDPYDEIPWIWTDQYDLNIQTLGVHAGCEHIVRGDMSQGKFTVFHLADGAMQGATIVNDVKCKKPALKLIRAGLPVEAAQLADLALDIRKL